MLDEATKAKYLYAPTYNPNTPDGMKPARAALQAHNDQAYFLNVEGWLGQVDGWVARNKFNRDTWISKGNTAESYVQDAFTPRPPVRTVNDYDPDTNMISWREDNAQNCPALAALFPAPTLPAFVTPPPSGPGITGKPPASQQQDVQNGIQFGMVAENNAMLKAIVAQLQIKVG